jgi:hypothetical protein
MGKTGDDQGRQSATISFRSGDKKLKLERLEKESDKTFRGQVGQNQLMRVRNRSGDAPVGGWRFFPWVPWGGGGLLALASLGGG